MWPNTKEPIGGQMSMNTYSLVNPGEGAFRLFGRLRNNEDGTVCYIAPTFGADEPWLQKMRVFLLANW